MPRETFPYADGSQPSLMVSWGDGPVCINGHPIDSATIDRLTAVLRRAAGKDRSVTVTLHADTTEYVASMERAKTVTRELADELRAAGVAKDDMGEAIINVVKLSTGE